MSDISVGAANEIDRRMALAREWDELVERVRKLDGFEDFLRPPALSTLLPAASGGPVVIVNVSRWRCDALILTPDGVQDHRLPNLTLDDTTERTNAYLAALQATEQAAVANDRALAAARESPGPATIRAQSAAATAVFHAAEQADAVMRRTQEWMWDTIANPLLDDVLALGAPATPEEAWPRVWWCPTGPLTLLPVHTAGYHDPAGGGVDTVLDRVVSSYTPTIRALLQARSERGDGPGAAPNDGRMLVVTVKDAPGRPRLDAVDREAAVLRELMAPDRRTFLEGPEAIRAAVDDGLAEHRWVHFSCHGDQNLAEPSQGGLLLSDGMLTVADIAARRFRGDFAGLSACKTAVGGAALLDEAITLAASLHYTGYRHVVASLWSVDSEISAEVFESLYRELIPDGELNADGAAVALHRAVRTIRDRHPDQPRLWTPFTHIGP